MKSVTRRSLRLAVSLLATVLWATPASAQDELPPDEPATALRVALDRALGEHAFLLGDVVRAGIVGGADFTAAANALEENSADVIGAITDVYGPEAGAAFGEQWQNHVAYVIDYSRAVAENDTDAAQLAASQLDAYVRDFSTFLAEAMPVLPPDAVQGLIGEHVQQLEHVASFHEHDFSGAYTAIRATYAHMYTVGDSLAIGIVSLFPDRFTGRFEAFSPATDFRLTLDRQLGEHSYLAAFAMRAVMRDATDVQGAAGALADNSAELRATIEAVYGSEAAAAFGALWDQHITAYVAYVSAVRDDDPEATTAALADLDDYRTAFSEYVADANPFVSQAAFEVLIGDHTDHLIEQADAYATGNYAASYTLGREAYAHSGEMARSLAGAIADQFPLLFPDTAAVPADAPEAVTLPARVVGPLLAVIGLTAATLAVVRARRRVVASG